MLNHKIIALTFCGLLGASLSAGAQTPIVLPEIVTTDTFVSFTPTKVLAPIREIKLVKGRSAGDDTEAAMLYLCPSDDPEDCLVEVTNENALNALLSQGAGSEGRSQDVSVGTYNRVVVGTGDKVGGDYFVYVEGEVKLDGVLHYTSSNPAQPLTTDTSKKGPVKIRFNMGGYDFPIEGGLVFAAGDSIELTLAFTDKFIAQAGTAVSKGAVSIGHCTHSYTHVANTNTHIPHADNPDIAEAGVCLRYPYIIPMVGVTSVTTQSIDLETTVPDSVNVQKSHLMLLYDQVDNARNAFVLPKVETVEDRFNIIFLVESLQQSTSATGYDIKLYPNFDANVLDIFNLLPSHNKVECVYEKGPLGSYVNGTCAPKP